MVYRDQILKEPTVVFHKVFQKTGEEETAPSLSGGQFYPDSKQSQTTIRKERKTTGQHPFGPWAHPASVDLWRPVTLAVSWIRGQHPLNTLDIEAHQASLDDNSAHTSHVTAGSKRPCAVCTVPPREDNWKLAPSASWILPRGPLPRAVLHPYSFAVINFNWECTGHSGSCECL